MLFSSKKEPHFETEEHTGIISVKNVRKTYTIGAVKVIALNDVNVTIEEGEIVSITGQSGSGKTTLLNLIGALDYAESGDIFIKGFKIRDLSDKQLSFLRRETIGYVFQSFNLLEELSAERNIEMPMILAGKTKEIRKKRVKELIDVVGLGQRAEHKPHQLSGGEQQRVAFARALANDPHIILADEPTGNLDSNTGEKIMELLLDVCKEKGKTLIYVTHNIDQSLRAKRSLQMNDGEVIKDLVLTSNNVNHNY